MTSIKLLLVLTLCVSSVFVQGGGSLKSGSGAAPHVPEKGSAERKAILDALRVPVEKQLKQPVIFKIDHLKVQNNWAFLTGRPQNSEVARLTIQTPSIRRRLTQVPLTMGS